MFHVETAWDIRKPGLPEHRSLSKEIGLRLHSQDEKHVLQPRTNGLSSSRLEPYETWERLIQEAKTHWRLYVETVRPMAISRVATRFINRLRLPMQPGEHFQEFLSKPPDVPDDLPQGVLAFDQRMVILNPELGCRANVTLSLAEGPAPADHVPVVLDIDVYSLVEIAADSDDVWNLLARLRVFKNEIFFASLTERAVALYE